MKKLLLSLILFTSVCSFSFANIMLQGEVLTCGKTFENLYYNNAPSKDAYFTPFNCPAVFLGYEFNSKDTEAKNHFYTGVSTSLFVFGIYTTPVFGWEYNLSNLGPVKVNLDLNAEIGPLWEIWGGVCLYNQFSTSIMFESQSKRGLYGGLGLSNALLYDVNLQAPSSNYSFFTYIGGRVFLGVKF